jgi:hypothetical protein
MAFEVGFFTITPENFYAFSELFHSFVDHGFISLRKVDKFYYAFLFALKEQLIPSKETLKAIDEGPTKKRNPIVLGQIDPNYIVPMTWSLLLTEDPSSFTPLALRLV